MNRDKIMMLNIPARKNTPETKLYVKILTQDNKSLGSRPIIFFLPGVLVQIARLIKHMLVY